MLIDGGTVWDVNIDSAMNQCHDMGATNEEITLDILVCATLQAPTTETGTTLTNWQTARSIKSYYNESNAIFQELLAVPGVTPRFYF